MLQFAIIEWLSARETAKRTPENIFLVFLTDFSHLPLEHLTELPGEAIHNSISRMRVIIHFCCCLFVSSIITLFVVQI